MKFELKFVDDIPKAVYLKKRGSPPGSKCIQYVNGGKVYVGEVSLSTAMTQIVLFSSTCTTMSPVDRQNYKNSVLDILDCTSDSTMMMTMVPEEKWKSYIEEKNTFYDNGEK